MNLRDFVNLLYRNYQLDWMMTHGHSLDELVRELSGYLEDTDEPLLESFWIWEQESGFGGEIWACFPEFLTSEFGNCDYICRISNQEQMQMYDRLLERLSTEYILCLHEESQYAIAVWSSDQPMATLELYYFNEKKAMQAIEQEDAVQFLKENGTKRTLQFADDRYWELADMFLNSCNEDDFTFLSHYSALGKLLKRKIALEK